MPGFKQSDVGAIPEDWSAVLLDSVAKRGSGHTPDKKHPEYWGGQIKWISLQDSAQLDRLYIDDTAAKITPEGIANSSAKLHPPGTVVLSRDAGVGKSAIMRGEMAVSQHFMAWTCGHSLSNRFLYYWLQGAKPEFERIAMGNTIKTIGLPFFRKLQIPLPRIGEQDRIVEVLSDADGLIESLEQLLAKKRQIKQGAMQELLTGKKRLPGFSSKWRSFSLGEIAVLIKGAGLSRNKVSQSGGRPCLLYGELFTTYGRVISRIHSRTDSVEGVESKAGDVLMPGSTTTSGIDLAAASALLENGVALGGDINIIRQRGGDFFDPVFLAYLLTHAYVSEISELAQGITIHHLYGRDLRKLPLQLPPLAEQLAVAELISDMDAEVAALEAKLAKARQLKQGMMQVLLTGQIRLPLDSAA